MDIKEYLKNMKFDSSWTLFETKKKLESHYKTTMSEWEYQLLIKEVEAYFKECELIEKKSLREAQTQIEEVSAIETTIVYEEKKERAPSKVSAMLNNKWFVRTVEFLFIYLIISVGLLFYNAYFTLSFYEAVFRNEMNFIANNAIIFMIISALVISLLSLRILVGVPKLDGTRVRFQLILSSVYALTSFVSFRIYYYGLFYREILSNASYESYTQDQFDLMSRISKTTSGFLMALSSILIYAAVLLTLGYVFYLLGSFIMSKHLETKTMIAVKKTIDMVESEYVE